ncbi:MAG: 30S ribosomal protein S6 [Candidatus Dojkabacteria bacterium]|nr:30S ribosomal protein S6 [Candidatus Dojkabacteria bacterium]MDQ7021705.1 30S ribosomal protein S6 [Candidatus Dojkabacteria bacterium]
MQKYELVLLFKPLLFEDIKNNALKKIETFIKDFGGTLTETDNIGKRLLAYPIKNFKEGYYVEYELALDPAKIKEFKTDLNLVQDVLRYLLIKR